MRPKLAFAIAVFIIPLLINSALIGSTVVMLIHDENPLFIVCLMTLSLCTALIVIKAGFNLWTEAHGSLESGPARRLTARSVVREPEEMVLMPIQHRPLGRSWTVPSRPLSPIPPPSPPPSTPTSRTRLVHFSRYEATPYV